MATDSYMPFCDAPKKSSNQCINHMHNSGDLERRKTEDIRSSNCGILCSTNNVSEHIVEHTDMPSHLVKTVTGQDVFEQTQPRVGYNVLCTRTHSCFVLSICVVYTETLTSRCSPLVFLDTIFLFLLFEILCTYITIFRCFSSPGISQSLRCRV